VIAKNKRVVNGYNLTDMELVEWIDPLSWGGSDVFYRAYAKIVEECADPQFLQWLQTFGLDNFLANHCWNIVNTEIDYIGDTEMFNRADWWCLPSECLNWKKGDCEDTAFLLAAALENVKLCCEREDDTYFAVLGYFVDQANYYGHGFVLYYNSYLQGWYVLETTWDNEISPFVWYNWDPNLYVPAIAFNRPNVLLMTSQAQRQKLGLSDSWYNQYEALIQDMINYVTTGKLLKVSWLHKKVRPAPVKVNLIKTMV